MRSRSRGCSPTRGWACASRVPPPLTSSPAIWTPFALRRCQQTSASGWRVRCGRSATATGPIGPTSLGTSGSYGLWEAPRPPRPPRHRRRSSSTRRGGRTGQPGTLAGSRCTRATTHASSRRQRDVAVMLAVHESTRRRNHNNGLERHAKPTAVTGCDRRLSVSQCVPARR